jgi:hypothetical protein
MATPANLPRFATVLRSLEEEERKGELSRPHADYSSHLNAWQILLDGFEGSGGFLDGGYLWPFPREDSSEFLERQAMARYHNYMETLVDLYVRQEFTQGVKRTSKDEEFNEWLKDVDGAGTPIDDVMRRFAAMSLVGGHTGVMVDKTRDEATGQRVADETARVFLTVFPNVSITDWRFKRNQLIGVKLLEAAPPAPLVAIEEADGDQQYLLWDLEGWARFSSTGELLEADMTESLGMVPLVLLRPKPSHVSRMLGRPLVGNANIVRALFNRSSEEDRVLRDQAFSVLTVSVPPEGDVAEAKQSLGTVVGTAKALVVKGQIKYETPSMEVPQTIRDNMAFLVQELYRAAHVRFRRDSLSSETAEAIRLQHTELNGRSLVVTTRGIRRRQSRLRPRSTKRIQELSTPRSSSLMRWPTTSKRGLQPSIWIWG